MKPYAPHITFFAVLLGLLILGITANVRLLAIFFGSLVGAATDPLLLFGALAIGGLSKNQKILLPVAIAFGLLLSVYIANLNAPLGAKLTPFIVSVRIVGIIGLALIANVVRLLSVGHDQSVKKYETINADLESNNKDINNE